MCRPLLLVAALSVLCANAQSIERQVIASAGTFLQGNPGSLSVTVGEAATLTLAGTNNTLTQGFQQPLPGDFSTAVPEAWRPSGLSLYPNPTREQLICEDPQGRILNFTLHDAMGREVRAARVSLGGQHRFDVSAIAPGTYWLTARDADGGQWSHPFIKQ